MVAGDPGSVDQDRVDAGEVKLLTDDGLRPKGGSQELSQGGALAAAAMTRCQSPWWDAFRRSSATRAPSGIRTHTGSISQSSSGWLCLFMETATDLGKHTKWRPGHCGRLWPSPVENDG